MKTAHLLHKLKLLFPVTLKCFPVNFILPGLECGEKHGCRHSAEDPTNEQPGEVGRHLGQAAEGVDQREGYGHFPAQTKPFCEKLLLKVDVKKL